jgi:hypothetical protein
MVSSYDCNVGDPMASRSQSYQKRREQREQGRKKRRRQSRKKRLGQERRRAQAALSGLESLFEELVLPSGLHKSLSKKLGVQNRMLGQLFAMTMPTAFGARSCHQLGRVVGFGKNRPGQLLRALPAPSWMRKFRRIGHQIARKTLEQIRDMSPATRSRWKPQLVVDSSVFRKYSDELLGLAGHAYSGQVGAIVLGIDLVLLLLVFGDGKLVVPLDFAIHRPKKAGPGRPGHSKLEWLEAMLERSATSLPFYEPPPLVADSWFGSSELMSYFSDFHEGLMLWQGKDSWVFYLHDGPKLKGKQLFEAPHLQWRFHPSLPGLLYARLRARSPSFGEVLLTLVKPPHDKPYYLICPPTRLPSTTLVELNRRRHWVEWCFRTLKHLLGTELCQVRTESAYYGHLVLRLIGLTILMLARQRRIAQGATAEEMLYCIRKHYHSLDSKILKFTQLSPSLSRKSA